MGPQLYLTFHQPKPGFQLEQTINLWCKQSHLFHTRIKSQCWLELRKWLTMSRQWVAPALVFGPLGGLAHKSRRPTGFREKWNASRRIWRAFATRLSVYVCSRWQLIIDLLNRGFLNNWNHKIFSHIKIVLQLKPWTVQDSCNSTLHKIVVFIVSTKLRHLRNTYMDEYCSNPMWLCQVCCMLSFIGLLDEWTSTTALLSVG